MLGQGEASEVIVAFERAYRMPKETPGMADQRRELWSFKLANKDGCELADFSKAMQTMLVTDHQAHLDDLIREARGHRDRRRRLGLRALPPPSHSERWRRRLSALSELTTLNPERLASMTEEQRLEWNGMPQGEKDTFYLNWANSLVEGAA